MRRGLMSWSLEEMPVAALDKRVARLQAAMHAKNMGAVLVYTSFAQPSAVHWLTNFTPYWSEALAVVLPEGAPILLASLTKRVHLWIKEVSHLADVVMAPRLGADAVTFGVVNIVVAALAFGYGHGQSSFSGSSGQSVRSITMISGGCGVSL